MNVNPQPGQTVVPLWNVRAVLTFYGREYELPPFHRHGTDLHHVSINLERKAERLNEQFPDAKLRIVSIEAGPITNTTTRPDPLIPIGMAIIHKFFGWLAE